MRGQRWIIAGTALAAAVGIWFWVGHAKSAQTARRGGNAPPANERPTPVLAAVVEQRDMPIVREGLGTVAAYNTVTVKSQVDGRIEKIAFIEGHDVKKGDLLVQIDARPYAIQLREAEAALLRDGVQAKNARLNLERYQKLANDKLIPVQQLTDQEAALAQAEAAVQLDRAQADAARLQISYAHITAPIDGRTGVRQVDLGNLVHPGDANGVVVLTQLEPIAVLFTLPEDDLQAVQSAMAEHPLSVEAYARDGDRILGTGKLALIDNQINQATGTIRLKAIFDNPKRFLWPNQFVKARLLLRVEKDALVIPAAVVQRGPKGTFAYVIKADDTAEARPIEVAFIDKDLAVIAKGLEVGEQVVADGQYRLQPGGKVSVRKRDGEHTRTGTAAHMNGRERADASSTP